MSPRTKPRPQRRTTARERTDHAARAARERIDRAARDRADATRHLRERALELALEAKRVKAEPDPGARASWLRERLGVDPQAAEAFLAGEGSQSGLSAQDKCILRTVQRTDDFQDLHYLDRARRAANAVGRFVEGTVDHGTFFMISRELLITNNHVIPDPQTAGDLLAQFGFERKEGGGGMHRTTEFSLDPDAFFMTDAATDMDFTVVALGPRVAGTATLEKIGACPLPRRGIPHGVGTFLNIIQHPDDKPKQIVMRENRLVCIPGNLLVYTTDTDGGSSGSPVFNDEWKVVGLHHWAGTQGTITLNGVTLPDEVREGIRARIIADAMRARRGELDTAKKRRMLDDAVGT